ncbi:MAG: DUF58 domain-containing protein [bacterium]
MFTQGWLALAALLIVVGLFAHQPVVLLLGAMLALGAAASYLWDRYCLWRVEYRRVFAPRRAFYGEEITLGVEVTNRKALPLAWVETVDELPAELEPLEGTVIPSLKQRRQHLVNTFSPRWYERQRRRIRLRCTARGWFTLGPVRLRSGDLFGFTLRGRDVELIDRLIVYPKVVPLEALGLPPLHPLGDARTPRLLFEDPTRTVGVRDYLPGDPLRRLHWKATARMGTLQSRLYESTLTHRLAIYVNIDTLGEYAEYRGFVRPLLELNLMVAASVAYWGIEQGHPVGLYANGYLPEGLRWIGMAPAAGAVHLALMLEGLAKVFPTPAMPVDDLIHLTAGELPWGTTAVIITAVVDVPLQAGILRLREAGHGVVLLLIGDRVRAPDVDVPVFFVRGEVGWRAMDELRLAPSLGAAAAARR